MTAIQIEPEALELLRAVKDGKVARHRLRVTESPEHGQDYEDVPGHGPGDKRKAAARLKPLVGMHLVRLVPGDPFDVNWLWKTTELGNTVLDIATNDSDSRSTSAQLTDTESELQIARAALITARKVARDRIVELEHTLNAVLATYVQPPGPGQESQRASYVGKDQVDAWKVLLYRTEQEQS